MGVAAGLSRAVGLWAWVAFLLGGGAASYLVVWGARRRLSVLGAAVVSTKASDPPADLDRAVEGVVAADGGGVEGAVHLGGHAT